jgi:parallel beta-helix repeat protein
LSPHTTGCLCGGTPQYDQYCCDGVYGATPCGAGDHPRLYLNPTRLATLRAEACYDDQGQIIGGCTPSSRWTQLRSFLDYDCSGSQNPSYCRGKRKAWMYALLYKVTQHPNDLSEAIDFMDDAVAAGCSVVGPCSGDADNWLCAHDHARNAALTYDWLYDDLNQAQRDSYMNLMNTIIYGLWNTEQPGGITQAMCNRDSDWGLDNAGNNFFWGFLAATAYIGVATEGENPGTFTWNSNTYPLTMYWNTPFNQGSEPAGAQYEYTDILEFLDDKLNLRGIPDWLDHPERAADGAWHEGGNYGRATKRKLFEMFSVLRDGGIVDLFNTLSFSEGSAYFQLYEAQPGNSVLYHGGDAAISPAMSVNEYNRHFMLMLGDGLESSHPTESSYIQYWLNHDFPDMDDDKLWAMEFLFYDPTRPEINYKSGPQSIPLSRHFDSLGWVNSRSSWDDDAISVTMVSSDRLAGHQHCDQNSFQIFRGQPGGIGTGGWLVLDVGVFAGDNRFTRWHNVIEVDGDGCQRNGVGTGDIIKYSSGADWAYTVGDASDAYWTAQKTTCDSDTSNGYSQINHYTRELVHLLPNYVVVYDRVVPVSATSTITEIFHFPDNSFTRNGNDVIASEGSGRVYYRALTPLPVESTVADYHDSGMDEDAQSRRVEIEYTTPRPSYGFMNLFDITSTSDSSIVTNSLIDDSPNMDGILIEDSTNKVVMFSKDTNEITTTSYNVGVPADHLVMNMQPLQSYEVYVAGSAITGSPFSSNDQGVLEFTAPAGGISIIQGSLPDCITAGGVCCLNVCGQQIAGDCGGVGVCCEANSCTLPCTLTSATWSTTGPVYEGTQVTLTVTGDSNCDGSSLSFVVWEDDALEDIGDDNVNVEPNNAVFSGTTATTTWTAEYQEDGIGGIFDPPEYYFIASEVGLPSNTITSTNELEVNELPDTTSPIISNVQASPSVTTATVTWTTDELSDSQVTYSVNSDLSGGVAMMDLSDVTSHSIELSGLTESTTYYYEVTSCDPDDNCQTDSIRSFTTITGGDCSDPALLCVNNPGTPEYTDIENAVSATSSGDTVLVYPEPNDGVYDLSSSIDVTTPNIILRGVDRNTVILDGATNPNTGDNTYGNVIYVNGYLAGNADGFTIESLTIRNAQRAGIRVSLADNVRVNDVSISNSYYHGILTGEAENVIIENSEFYNTQIEHGIYVSNAADNPIVRNNTVYGNSGNGIQLNGDCYTCSSRYTGTCDGTISNAILSNNKIYSNYAKGYSLISVTNSEIENNLIFNNQRSCIIASCSGAGGIHFADEPACGNPSDNNIAKHNTVVEPTMAGIRITHGSNNVIFNNLVVTLDDTPIDDESGSMNYVSNNIETTSSANLFVSYTNDDDPSDDNFYLTLGSNAKDYGAATYQGETASTTDFNGNPRPSGIGYDAGAYEFQEGGQVCGNDIREGTEACDGTDLAGETCISQGFDAGTLSCTACSFDTTQCYDLTCELTGAYWETGVNAREIINDNEIATITVTGTNCDGKTLTFEVWDEDIGEILPDDLSSSVPSNAIFSGTTATTTWTGRYEQDGTGGQYDPPEYYFIATEAGSSPSNTIRSSNLLEVYDIVIDNPPTVTLGSPNDGFTTVTGSASFDCSAIDDNSVTDITLYTNISGTWQQEYTVSDISLIHTINNIPDGTYTWNCEATDSIGQTNYAVQNRTINAALTNNPLYYSNENVVPPSLSPYVPDQQHDFSIEWYDDESSIDTVWIEHNLYDETAPMVNETISGTGNTYTYSIVNLVPSSNYEYNWCANDTTGQTACTGITSFWVGMGIVDTEVLIDGVEAVSRDLEEGLITLDLEVLSGDLDGTFVLNCLAPIGCTLFETSGPSPLTSSETLTEGTYIINWQYIPTDSSLWLSPNGILTLNIVQDLSDEVTMIVNLDSANLNTFSIPMLLEDYSISSVFGPALNNLRAIYGYSNGRWQIYHSDPRIPDSLTELEPKRGYFVQMVNDASITLTGNRTNETGDVPEIDLEQGWNLIGLHNTELTTIDSIIDPAQIDYSSIWEFDENNEQYTELTETDQFMPAKAYWVKVEDVSSAPRYGRGDRNIIDWLRDIFF